MEIMSRLVSKQVLDFFLMEDDFSWCSLLHISETGLHHFSCQIWKYPKLWVGFLKCAILTKPQSYGVLLQVGTHRHLLHDLFVCVCIMLNPHLGVILHRIWTYEFWIQFRFLIMYQDFPWCGICFFSYQLLNLRMPWVRIPHWRHPWLSMPSSQMSDLLFQGFLCLLLSIANCRYAYYMWRWICDEILLLWQVYFGGSGSCWRSTTSTSSKSSAEQPKPGCRYQ